MKLRADDTSQTEEESMGQEVSDSSSNATAQDENKKDATGEIYAEDDDF
jgi:hypothetical protein